MEELTDSEIHIIGECLRASAEGPFFRDKGSEDPYWEFHSLFGLEHDELVQIAAAWPNVERQDEAVTLAINSSLGNLLGYPHHCEKEWSSFISASVDEVAAVFERWRVIQGAS